LLCQKHSSIIHDEAILAHQIAPQQYTGQSAHKPNPGFERIKGYGQAGRCNAIFFGEVRRVSTSSDIFFCFKRRTKYETTKATILFPPDKQLPLALMKKPVEARVRKNEEAKKKK
jgi:hypothetical protein